MNIELKNIRQDADLLYIDEFSANTTVLTNSGNLEADFYKYAKNFYEAAEKVICYLLEVASEKDDTRKLDIWFFSMVYLFRQSLELMLKAIIFQSITDKNERKNIIGSVRHDLKQSYEKLIDVKKFKNSENENARWLKAYLSDISKIDKESDMFRYPFGNNSEELLKKQTHISLEAIRDNMKKAYNIIKGIYDTEIYIEDEIEAYNPQLITEGGDYYNQSVTGYNISKYSFYPYLASYREVGEFLKNIMIRDKKDNLFFPMCYVYRNAIELALKRLIIEDSHIDNDKSLKIAKKKKHSILGLWNSIKDEIIKYSYVPDDDTTLPDTEKYIKMFHNFDMNSDVFRYPCNKDMESYFILKEEKKLDIENVALCFEELYDFLDGVDEMFSSVKYSEA